MNKQRGFTLLEIILAL
ncbi:TPA_asm: prepilin-type N-terminal cleavage/methylation domain-containing protein, partial [Salmonella enterica]|nr:prepilin-type N-terminal cleavage/methylation domain-containing protein [Salmonella enterica]